MKTAVSPLMSGTLFALTIDHSGNPQTLPYERKNFLTHRLRPQATPYHYILNTPLINFIVDEAENLHKIN